MHGRAVASDPSRQGPINDEVIDPPAVPLLYCPTIRFSTSTIVLPHSTRLHLLLFYTRVLYVLRV